MTSGDSAPRAPWWLAWVMAALLIVAALVGTVLKPTPPKAGGPGGTIAFQTALPPPVTWTADGGTITASGSWTAPACGAATFPATYRITATSPSGEQSFTVRIEEAVLGVAVIGAQVTGESTFRPGPTITLRPGQTAQFYAKTTFTCHEEYSPSRPPGV